MWVFCFEGKQNAHHFLSIDIFKYLEISSLLII